MLFFSLGGLPPFLGFWGKWMVFISAGLFRGSFILLRLLLRSFLVFYFYLKNLLLRYWSLSSVRPTIGLFFLVASVLLFYVFKGVHFDEMELAFALLIRVKLCKLAIS